MAEIRVERKKASPWTWLIALLLLALLLWGLSRLLGTGGAPEVRDDATPVGALPQGNHTPAAKAPALAAPGDRRSGRSSDRGSGKDSGGDSGRDSDRAEALRLRSRLMA